MDVKFEDILVWAIVQGAGKGADESRARE